MLQLYPFIRSGRAVGTALLFPIDPVEAATLSEFASVTLPLLFPAFRQRIVSYLICLLYSPSFISLYDTIEYNDKRKTYQNIELFGLMLIIIYSFV